MLRNDEIEVLAEQLHERLYRVDDAGAVQVEHGRPRSAALNGDFAALDGYRLLGKIGHRTVPVLSARPLTCRGSRLGWLVTPIDQESVAAFEKVGEDRRHAVRLVDFEGVGGVVDVDQMGVL